VQNVLDSLYYAVNNGARLSNNSYGAPATALTEAERTAAYAAIHFAASKGHLFVAVAGNDDRDTDGLAQPPASYDLPNIISVAATTRNDKLAHISNYESTSVDLLTVLVHEVGHLLGKEQEVGGVMAETLSPGTRRAPFTGSYIDWLATVDVLFAEESPHKRR
jgi:subtilisin family serine protease